MSAKRITVAVGIMLDQQGRFLVGQRVARDQYFGKWEFPGGKLEPGESAAQALVRELNEELGVEVISSRPLMEHQHDYPDRLVHLYVRLVNEFNGDIQAREGQALRWVTLSELTGLDFLQGNRKIITTLQELFPVDIDASKQMS